MVGKGRGFASSCMFDGVGGGGGDGGRWRAIGRCWGSESWSGSVGADVGGVLGLGLGLGHRRGRGRGLDHRFGGERRSGHHGLCKGANARGLVALYMRDG